MSHTLRLDTDSDDGHGETDFLLRNQRIELSENTEERFRHSFQPTNMTNQSVLSDHNSESDLSPEHRKSARKHFQCPQVLKPRILRTRFRHWQPSRRVMVILLVVNICFMIGILIWFSQLVLFLKRVSHPPMPDSGILHMLNNNTPSLSNLDRVKSILPFPSDFTRDVLPIPCHSHNDYWRHTPLFDAISVGCTSVEADIWVAGRNAQAGNSTELYVGHSAKSLRAARTLRAMYLDPLMYIFDQLNNNEKEYAGIFETNPNTTLVLLLDFKDSPSKTNIWDLVQTHLEPFRQKGYLTHWNITSSSRVTRPLTIVATGDASFDQIRNSSTKDIFFDAPLSNLDSAYNQSNSYYASVSLKKGVGRGALFPLTSGQRQTVAKQANDAKQLGLISRYWSTPSWPVNVRNTVWEQLLGEGVGVLNVDALWTAGLRDWRLCWAVGWGICP